MSLTPDQAAAAIRKSAGRFFGCSFIKADGTARHMWCRYAEVKKVEQHRVCDTAIAVWDNHVKGWRSIPIARLVQLRIDGKTEMISF